MDLDNRSCIFLHENCKIITMNRDGDIFDSMAVFQGRILAIGPVAKVYEVVSGFMDEWWHGPGDPPDRKTIMLVTVDLKGKCVIPAFIDVHMHPALYIILKTQLNSSGIRSKFELGKKISDAAASVPEGKWIIGYDLMEDVFIDPDERCFPDRYEIDTWCADKPVLLIRHDGHICSVNSKIIGMLELDVDNDQLLLDGKRGEILRDERGIPTGIFTEEAVSMVLENVPVPDLDVLEAAARKRYHGHGRCIRAPVNRTIHEERSYQARSGDLCIHGQAKKTQEAKEKDRRFVIDKKHVQVRWFESLC
ncbi:MAG: amidohydrolase family protein [Promethearchaeota archaeon]